MQLILVPLNLEYHTQSGKQQVLQLMQSNKQYQTLDFWQAHLWQVKKWQHYFGYRSTCNCVFPTEKRSHILLDCTTYNDLRTFSIEKMLKSILLHHIWIITEQMTLQRQTLQLLLLDLSWFRKDIGSSTKGLPNIIEKSTADDLERMWRTLYQIFNFEWI